MRTYTLSLAFGKDHDPFETRSSFLRAHSGTIVQTVNEKTASNGFFVQMIAAQTVNAGRAGCLLAKKAEIDFLLRLAGTTQISEAISRVGSKRGEPFLLLVASGRPIPATVPAVGGRKLPRSPLSESELARVERAALLNARRA